MRVEPSYFPDRCRHYIDRNAPIDQESTACHDADPCHQPSPLYEDITSPPANSRRDYPTPLLPTPPLLRIPQRHWSEVRPTNMHCTCQIQAKNMPSFMHRRFSMDARGNTTYGGCFNCGERNHKRAHCMYTQKLQCRACGQLGHKAKHCSMRTEFR